MHHFEYRGDELFCEGVALKQIAEAVGTPTYIYSHATLERHYRVFDQALKQSGKPHLICYSVKANSNLAVLRTLIGLGAGVDTVSRGEIARALAVGCDPKKIVFSGVGKRDDEIEFALNSGILALNVESHGELEAIERVAARIGVRAQVALRLNPDVDAETHPYISTGLTKNKFGIPVAQAKEEFRFVRAQKHLDVIGIDCHIGSQLTKTAPFLDAIYRLGDLARALAQDGVQIRTLDIGGGLGIPYKGDGGETPPSPDEYAAAVTLALKAFGDLEVTLICEPGRVIVGNAGVLLTRTLYVKQGEVKNFVIVDAAMNDLIRPAFYDSYHAIWPVEKRPADPIVCDVVGPICETGDFLARDRQLETRPQPGDLLSVMSAGAYGFTMASNYNTRPRPAEVMVRGEEFFVVRKREELAELWCNESVPAFLQNV